MGLEVKSFVCSYCGKAFVSKDLLVKHEDECATEEKSHLDNEDWRLKMEQRYNQSSSELNAIDRKIDELETKRDKIERRRDIYENLKENGPQTKS